MANNSHDDDDDERKDLTRIEDLSEFLHQEDADLESKFEGFNPTTEDATSALNVDDLPPDLPEEMPEEIPEETSSGISFSDDQNDNIFESSSLEENFF